MAEKRKVRTTFRPDLEVEVSEQEYTDLRRQGLLVEQEQEKSAAESVAERNARTRRERERAGTDMEKGN